MAKRENFGPQPARRSAEVFPAKPVVGGASIRSRKPAENVGPGRTEELAEGEELGSNVLLSWCDRITTWECDRDPNRAFEKTAEFAVEKFCLSLGQGREPSNLRCSGLTIIAAYERFPARAELLRHACQL
jgi:hypothetical protein